MGDSQQFFEVAVHKIKQEPDINALASAFTLSNDNLFRINYLLSSYSALSQNILPFFQAHVAESATIADHCSTYALSDSKEDPFKSTCNHSHDKRGMQCETLKDVLEKVETCFVDCEVSPEELDDLTYSCRQAVDSIKGWKAHQLRSWRQDEAGTSILNTLDERSVHVTQDWAMKFLPQKYRESQSDWFGKRGISWHMFWRIASRKATWLCE